MGFSRAYILAALVAIVAVAGAYVIISGASGPTVANGDTIKVYYTGTFTNGTVFDSNIGKQPLQFTVGSGQMIKGFDQGVIGMRVNKSKTITIPANEAYGQVNPNLVMRVPMSQFGNRSVQVGAVVGARLNGQVMQGVIKSVNSTTVTVDFNPALAGQTLVFNITVVSIQKVSA